MRALLSFFKQLLPGSEPQDSDTIRRIATELDRLEPDTARFVAAFAFLLSRIAAADHEVTPDEARTMEALVGDTGGLPLDQAVLVVELAKTQQRLFGSTDDFLVTRELARMATHEQKLSIIRCLFAVAAADRRIRVEEGDEIGRIANELRVEQSDLSRIRAEYREFLRSAGAD